MTQIALNFQDGFTRIIDAWDGETVANAAYRQRVNIPMDCGNGACGTCKCRVRSGDYSLGDEYLEEALTEAEAAEGLALACQMIASTDLVIDVFASSRTCKVQPEVFSVVIAEVQLLSADIIKLTARAEDGRAPRYLPGQYAKIEIPGSGQSRSFSFSIAPGGDTLEFVVRLLPDGLASGYFRTQAAAGQKLNITAPFGTFYLRPIQAPTLFFAGGTGIAPFLAMLDTLAANSPPQGAMPYPIALYYGATSDRNVVELPRLEAFKTLLHRLPFDYHVCVSAESAEPSQKYAPGFVTQWIKKEQLGQAGYEAYVCGPPPMVDAVKSSLYDEGIALSNFFTEKFVPSGGP